MKKTKPITTSKQGVNQLITSISDLLYEDADGVIYQKVMNALLNLLEKIQPPNSMCQTSLDDAIDFWRNNGSNENELLVHHKIFVTYLNKHDLWYKKNDQSANLLFLYMAVLKPFRENQGDEHCDRLYYFVEHIRKIGASSNDIACAFEPYFSDL